MPREVLHVIREAKRDPHVSIGYGDAIQIGPISGGRVGTKKRPFCFTYSPTDDPRRGVWWLTLHPMEIEDIVDGRLSAITMNCCESKDCRCKFREEDETCGYCDNEEDEEEKLAGTRLNVLAAAAKSKKEWVTNYLQINPNANVAEMIFDYGMSEGLKEQFGNFELREAFEMHDACRPIPPTEKPA